MRLAQFLILSTALLPAQDSPRTFATADDLTRAQQRAAELPWAKAAVDQIVNSAKAWPQSHLTKYGLTQLEIPAEGGQWTLWYVCPVHGVSLRYTPPSTHTCPIDNKRWSGWPYEQVILDRRHDDLANAARDLALAWRFTGEPQFAAQAAWILNRYAARYTTYALHDKDNKNTRSGARAHSQTLDESVWLLPVAWAYDLLAGADALTPADRAAIESTLLRAAVETIQRNDAGASNWQSWHNAAIGAAGFALADRSLIAAAIDGKSGFRFQMLNSVTPDGYWYEGAWGYHFYALDPLLRLSQMAWTNGIDLYANPPLRAMFASPLLMVMPNGNLPAFNDSKEVTLFNYDTLYETAWSMYMEPGFEVLLGRRSRGLNALLWGAPEINKAPLTGLASAAFPESGYAVLRAPEGDHMLALKFGPHGGGHGHYDKLNFVSYANGATMALDPGTQSYAAPTHNTWDKVTIAHNTVTVDETTQAESTGALIWAELAHPLYRAVRATAGAAAYKQATLTRTMLLTSEYTVDLFEAQATYGTDHIFDWAFHMDGALTTALPTEPYTAFPAKSGYQHLAEPRAAQTSDSWQATFDPNPTGPITYGSVYNSNSNVRGTFQTTTEQAASGRFAAKATYELNSAGYILFSTPILTGLPDALPTSLSLMIHGDASGHRIGVRLYDAGGEKYVKPLGTIDWTGWKRFDIPTDLANWTHYQGDENNVFNVPVSQFNLELTAVTTGLRTGALFIDDVTLAYESGPVVAADFETPQRNLRLWMLGAPDTTVVTGAGLGPDLTHPVPFAIAHRTGGSASFVTLLEPYRATPRITKFEQLPDGTLRIEGDTFTDTFRLTPEGVQSFNRCNSGPACASILSLGNPLGL
ncbi:MAG TPA: heparinase II/III family protein [Paludibaculum sp.]|jgi:hypothetical protein